MHSEDAILAIIRLFVIIAGPCTLAVLAVSLLVGVIQAATTIQDKTIAYVARLGALIVALYLVMPDAARALSDFTKAVLQ